jgi:hypothetical protein
MMPTHVNGLTIRRVLGREQWRTPERFGPDGWCLSRVDGCGSVIVTTSDQDDGLEWTHASWAFDDRLPTYEELVLLRSAVWGSTGWAFQVFAPPSSHVNIHRHALHLWGRADGANPFPDFGATGSI